MDTEIKENSTNQYKKWLNCKRDLFLDAISTQRVYIDSIYNELEMAGNPNQDDINNIVNRLSNLFVKTAKETLLEKRHFHYDSHKKFEPWFTKKCFDKRKAFHKARRKYSWVKNAENKANLKSASRLYKTELNKGFSEYSFQMERELRNTSKFNSKKFWNIINKFSGRGKQERKVSLHNLFDYFRNLNQNEDANDDNSDIDIDFNDIQDEYIQNIMNGSITENEVIDAIKNLKNGKAPGLDEVVNEYIKTTSDYFIPLYTRLFNIILDNGIIPESWTNGVIQAIYKNKGDPTDPDSYRAITLISNLGKLFTSILNVRLARFAEYIELITKSQAGFRKGFSTTDNLFCLYALIQIYLCSGKKLYCTFVDFKKAFDTVWRVGLWKKLLASGINGKILRVIINMYENIKSCVKQNNEVSEFFSCQIGVRQGENLSPFLFAIFLNDLEKFFIENEVSGLESIKNLCEERIQCYINLFVLLYADDTILLAETPEKMQNVLYKFEEYCTQWKLKVNSQKTKVIIFSKRKSRLNFDFRLFGSILSVVDECSYLGLTFKYNGNFATARKNLIQQAQKSLFALFRRIRNLNIPVDLQLKLFDSLVAPILLYSSEVWGYENSKDIEKVHLQFIKKIFGIRMSTPNYMVYGESGRYPLYIQIKLRMLNFWKKLLENPDKLCGILYRLMLNLHGTQNYDFKWIDCIKSTFDSIGLSYIWDGQYILHKDDIKGLVKQKLLDIFFQNWYSDMGKSSRGEFYLCLKQEFGIEKYLLNLCRSNRHIICKLRCSNIKFPVETGRWAGLSLQNRTCHLCNSGEIGNEYHYFFVCNHDLISVLRSKYIPKYYIRYPSIYKMYGLFSMCNVKVLNNVSIFLKKLEKIL